MMRRTIAVIVSVLASAAALVVVSPVAQADNTRCPANRFCLFEHDDFGGGRADFSGADTDLTDNFWSGGSGGRVHNGASSMINNTGRFVTVRSDAATCRGDDYSADPESEDANLTNNDFDNEASCVLFI